MRTPFICFDIETAPLIDRVELFWKPDSRLKDPAKIAESLALAKSRAALDPLTGKILVIGLMDQDGQHHYIEGEEASLILEFWRRFEPEWLPGHADARFCFWSGSGSASTMFDIDYIVTRSRLLGVKVPPQVRNGRFYSSRIIDLASEFLLFQTGEYLSLSNAGHAFGLYEDGSDCHPKDKETDEVTGENFHKVYAQDRAKALSYLENDLHITRQIALRIL